MRSALNRNRTKCNRVERREVHWKEIQCDCSRWHVWRYTHLWISTTSKDPTCTWVHSWDLIVEQFSSYDKTEYLARNVQDILLFRQETVISSIIETFEESSRSLEETLLAVHISSLLSLFVRKEIRGDAIFSLTFAFDARHAFLQNNHPHYWRSLDPSR